MKSWNELAEELAADLVERDVKTLKPRQVNGCLLSMLGLTSHKDCRSGYLNMANKIELDGVWGPTATATHQLLAEICGSGTTHDLVQRYYK